MAFQASSGSARERWIKALLPAAVIVLIYVLMINLGRGREIKDLRSKLASTQENGTSEAAVAMARQEVLAATRRRDELKAQIEAAQSGIDASLAQFTDGSPATRVLEVDRLCRELSIALVRQTVTTEVDLSRVRRQSLETLRKLSPGEVTYRQLDVVGRYGDVVTLLKRLPEMIEGAVPLGVELSEGDQSGAQDKEAGGRRMWRVYLLM